MSGEAVPVPSVDGIGEGVEEECDMITSLNDTAKGRTVPQMESIEPSTPEPIAR